MNDEYPDIRPVSDADASLLPWSKGPVWKLYKPWPFAFRDENGRDWHFTIPAGFLFDGQSVPSIFHAWPLRYGPSGVGMRAGLCHDWLCEIYNWRSEWVMKAFNGIRPDCPSPQAIHQVYYDIQMEDGQRPRKAKAMWLAVRLFGPGGLLRPSTIWKGIIS